MPIFSELIQKRNWRTVRVLRAGQLFPDTPWICPYRLGRSIHAAHGPGVPAPPSAVRNWKCWKTTSSRDLMVSGKATLVAYGLRKRTTTNKIKHFRFRRRHNFWPPHNRPTQLTGTQRAERVWRATSGTVCSMDAAREPPGRGLRRVPEVDRQTQPPPYNKSAEID